MSRENLNNKQEKLDSIIETITDPKTTQEQIAKLLNTDDRMLKYELQELAENPDTDPSILATFAKSADEQLIYCIAINSSTPESTLRGLAKTNFEYIEQYLCSNPNLPTDLIELIYQRANIYTLRSIARNPNTPQEILDQIEQKAISEDKDLDWRLTMNPNTTAQTLNRIYNRINTHPEHAVTNMQKSLLIHPNTPSNVLEALAHKNMLVGDRENLARHPNTPANVLRNLIENKNGNISHLATENLASKNNQR